MTPDEVRAIVREALEETVEKAEAEAGREKVEKAVADAVAAIGELKAALAKATDEVAALAGRVQALEQAPSAPGAPVEGGQAGAAASFI